MPNEDKKLAIATEELKIVRKFLRRNKLTEMCAVLQQIGDQLHGAEVFSGYFPVPTDVKTTNVFTNVDWDTDGYFDPANPSRLTVPDGLGGRYFVQVAIRWYNPQQVVPPPPDDIEVNDSFFYSYVSMNGNPHAVGNDARSTVNMVGHGATGTTQHYTFDMSLNAGEFIEVKFWQDFFDPVRNDTFLTLRRLGS